MSEIPTMPRVSKCDRSDACPEPLDHDSRCPKFDAEFWSKVKVTKRGEPLPFAAFPSYDEPAAAESDVEALAKVLVPHQRTLDGPGSCRCGEWPPAELNIEWTTHLAAEVLAAGYLPPAEVARRERVAAEKALREVQGRASDADLRLRKMADDEESRSAHLFSKAEGVRLVMGYIGEALRSEAGA